eukprot:TRINITY_DN18381_c0_g1_i1.p1 TRINITY_DN18381_c0_g1~~TRINITY_DN18381_c0_g1_i1.p1  ORF type:complete len:895 (-),score=181.95 TRINITY_DN18381_c0_g1_i1:46-2730(-)
MTASNIKVFLRVRPSAKPSSGFQANPEQNSVTIELDKPASDTDINNNKTSHTFRFDGILGMKVSQDDVLNTIAKPVIDDVLNGVNGTIFAYGQTGSGKTFTITGGASRYADRGLIPRTIATMFECFRKGDAQYRMYISYLEIYQDSGYDLLRDDSAQKLEDLPKVQLREDEDGNMHLRNLSVNLAASEEDALNLLFMGDTNRVVAETPMNDASTRSHCLFIIWVDSTQPGSDVVRRSKLHLVDLAGSERVSQTGVEGKLLKEAKAINLSLHYLERVIVALHARSRGSSQAHVPYRDSMMTSVLRDSLGGNCKTTMIGCIASEAANLPETISTCRFAQRVAQITNNAKVNEELDPNLLIARLKREVSELKEEVRIAKMSKDGKEPEALTPESVEQCRALVLQYISKGANPDEPFMCGSVERLRVAFRILRDLSVGGSGGEPGYVEASDPGHRRPAAGYAGGKSADPARQAALEAEIKKLQLEVAQRDQEITVMVQMLGKQRGAAGGRPFISAASVQSASAGVDGSNASFLASTAVGSSSSLTDALSASCQTASLQSEVRAASSTGSQGATGPLSGSSSSAAVPQPKAAAGAATSNARRGPGDRRGPAAPSGPSSDEAAELLLDKQKALEVFRQTIYKPPAAFEENKALLKEKIAQAKVLGDEANQVRAGINSAKTRLERLRTERAMTAAGHDDDAPLEDGPEELAEVQEIDRFKAMYRDRTNELRRVKSDVEGIQRLLEQNKLRMQREFESWFSGLRHRAQLGKLDEEKKKALYDKVSGASAPGSTAVSPTAKQTSTPYATETPEVAPTTVAAAAAASSLMSVSAPPSKIGSALTAAAASSPVSAGISPGQKTKDSALARAAAGPPKASGSAAGNRAEDEIAAYYAALGELSRRA